MSAVRPDGTAYRVDPDQFLLRLDLGNRALPSKPIAATHQPAAVPPLHPPASDYRSRCAIQRQQQTINPVQRGQITSERCPGQNPLPLL